MTQPTTAQKEEKVIIENPGKGSCGFYAIAIGLIPTLRQEIIKSPLSLEQKYLQIRARENPAFLLAKMKEPAPIEMRK